MIDDPTADFQPSPAPVDTSLLQPLRALVDPSRLRMAGLLATRPMTVDEMDHGFMSREGGRYRLRAVEDWPAVSA